MYVWPHVDYFGYMPYEQAESPEVRVLLGGPDQRLFDFAGNSHSITPSWTTLTQWLTLPHRLGAA